MTTNAKLAPTDGPDQAHFQVLGYLGTFQSLRLRLVNLFYKGPDSTYFTCHGSVRAATGNPYTNGAICSDKTSVG